MQNKVVKGTFLLLIGGLISKLIGAFYRIPLSNILGAEGIGIFQLIYPVYSLIIVFITGGLGITITRKVASYRANNDFGGVVKTVKSGLVISIVYGIVFGVMIALGRNLLAHIQGNSVASIGYLGISLAMVFSCIICVYRGYFQGYENMLPTTISQILEQLFKLIFGIVLAYAFAKYGVQYSVLGALFGVAIGEIVSFIYLLVSFLFNLKKQPKRYVFIKFYDVKSNFLSMLPISFGAIVLPLSVAVDSFLVVNLLTKSGFTTAFSTSLFGIYSGMVMPIVNFPVVIMATLSTSLLPSLSYNYKKNINSRSLMENSIKFIWCFIIPCILGYILLSQNILTLLYPALEGYTLSVAKNLILFLSINMLFVSMIQISTTILQSRNHYKFPTLSLGLGVLFKFVLEIVLLSNQNINIVGLGIASVFGFSLTALLNFAKLKKCVVCKLSIKDLLLPLFSSLVMSFVIVPCLMLNTKIGVLFCTILSIFVGSIVYLSLVFLFKVFRISEIKSLFKN